MSSGNDRIPSGVLHPIHGALLAGALPLYLGGLLSDYAYSSTYHVQWTNFASWLIAGGLVFNGLALLWSLIRLIITRHRSGIMVAHVFLLLITWALGFYNSLIHAKDAWATMPTGMVLSIIVVILACASTWVGFAKFGVGSTR